jgi:type IV secretion system protein VirB10
MYVDRPAPPPVIRYVQVPSAPPPNPPLAMQEAMGARATEPALVIDLTDPATAQGQPAEDSPARATVLAHKSTIVAQGTVIPAVLETPIDSNHPGAVRAITSADTRGFDQARVLIPKGSRLFGEYKSDVQSGQARVLVTWTRLVRPDGVSVRLTSPGADRRGGAGFPGAVDNHLIAHLGSVVLQSALAAGVDLASRSGNGSSVVINAPAQVGTVGPPLLPGGDARPTITVKEGAVISALVARDLDFSGALPRS